MCIQKSIGFVDRVQVSEFNHTLICIEQGRNLGILTLIPFHICKEIFASSLVNIIKNKRVHPLYIVGLAAAILADGVDLEFFLLHCCQVGTEGVLSCFKSKIF